jgi:hypothetical protein
MIPGLFAFLGGAALGQLETQLATRKLDVVNALKYAMSGPLEVCGRTRPRGWRLARRRPCRWTEWRRLEWH